MNARKNVLGIFTFLVLVTLRVHSEEPSGDELLRRVPSFSTQAEAPSSFQVKCRCLTHDDIPTDIDIRWQDDGRYSLLLSDASTQTPIACFSDNGFALYNALERTVTFGPEVTPEFRLFASDDSKIKIEFSWNQPDAKEPAAECFEIDLRSFAMPDAIRVETTQGGKCLEMSSPSSSGKSLAKWEFVCEPEIAFERFTINRKLDDAPVVRVDEVKTGDSVSAIVAPTSLADGATLQAIHWEPGGMPSFVELVTDVFGAIGGHAALTNEKYRGLKSYRHVTDWESVVVQAKNDRSSVMDLFSLRGE